MFKNPPKILAHKAALTTGNFVVPEYIINKSQDKVMQVELSFKDLHLGKQ